MAFTEKYSIKPCTCTRNGEFILCFKKDKNSPCMRGLEEEP